MITCKRTTERGIERKRRRGSVTDSAGVVADVELCGKKMNWADDLKCMPVIESGNVRHPELLMQTLPRI